MTHQSKRPWRSLTPEEKRERKLGLEVFRGVRNGLSLQEATQKVGVSVGFVQSIVGDFRDHDDIETEMHFYERNRGVVSVVTADSHVRSVIGSYFANVKMAIHENDPSYLESYRDLVLVDANGNEHRFETDLDRIYEIQDWMEEPEFFELYRE